MYLTEGCYSQEWGGVLCREPARKLGEQVPGAGNEADGSIGRRCLWLTGCQASSWVSSQGTCSREVFQRSNAFGKWGPLGENVGVSSPPGQMSLKALLLATSSETLRAQHRLQLTIGTGVGTEAAKGTYAHPQQRAGTLLSQPAPEQSVLNLVPSTVSH